MDKIYFAKNIKNNADGLSLMILFTIIWTFIAEAAIKTIGYQLIGVVFFVTAAMLIYNYIIFNKVVKEYPYKLPGGETLEEKAKNKKFVTIFIIEGVTILIALNVLVNLNMSNYFIPVLALIVGLHFFPLARLFKRKIHNYIGAWITFIAVLAILMCITHLFEQDFVTAFTGFGCAAGTSMMGVYMIKIGKKYNQLLTEVTQSK